MTAPTHPRLRLALAAAGLLLGLGLGPLIVSCLPGDTRPTPGELDFTVEPGEALGAGLTTRDGWTITFERFLVGIGGAAIRGDRCNNYSGGSYNRLIEAAVPGSQKLATVYGLGTCTVRFRVLPPFRLTVLGEGVSEDDLAFMNAADEDDAGLGGTSVYVQGVAKRNGASKHFAWNFRQFYTLHDCGADGGAGEQAGDPDAGDSVTIDLHGGELRAMPIHIQAEELFREGPEDDAGLRFGALASADLDEDQEITLEELAMLPSPVPLEDAGDTGDDGGADAGAPTLTQFIYSVLLPRMFLLEKLGRCTASDRFGRP